MSKPVLTAGLLVVAGGAWYWALSPVAVPTRRDGHVPAQVPASVEVPHVRLEQLARAEPVPSAVQVRDPFRPGATPGTRGRMPSVAASVRQTAAAASPTPASWPRLELIGVAEGKDGDVLVRTAILSGPLGVHHARAGQTLEQVYRLERVSADGVELRLLPEDRVLRLRLRP